MQSTVYYDLSLFEELDIYLFKQGNHYHLYNKLGSHLMTNKEGEKGTYFAVWAPNAKYVSVKGDFNEWDPKSHPLKMREDESGIWEGFITSVKQGTLYKYHIQSRYNNYKVDKTDPFAFFCEQPPNLASIVWDLDYEWQDRNWMQNRKKCNSLTSPFSVYEVHLVPGGEFHKKGIGICHIKRWLLI